MTNATHDCTGCPVSAGTHKPADAVHLISEPAAALVAEPVGRIAGGEQTCEMVAACDSAANLPPPAHPAEGVPAPVAVGMREAFEAWARDYGTWEVQRDDDRDLGTTGYTDVSLTVAWHAQARAALAATPAAPAVPANARQMLVDAGAPQMVVNALRRDAEEGKTARGEMADELLATATPAAGVPAAPDARDAVSVPSWALVELLRESKGLDRGHIYSGLCPEASQPDSRDEECECCRAIDAVDAAIAAQAGKGVA